MKIDINGVTINSLQAEKMIEVLNSEIDLEGIENLYLGYVLHHLRKKIEDKLNDYRRSKM